MQQKFLPPREQPYFANPLFPLFSIPLDSKASFLAIYTLIFTNPQSVHRTVYSTYLRSTSSSFVSIIWTKWPIVSHTYTFSYTSPFSSTYITLNNSVTFHIFTLFTGTPASFDRWTHWPLLSHSRINIHACIYLHMFLNCELIQNTKQGKQLKNRGAEGAKEGLMPLNKWQNRLRK